MKKWLLLLKKNVCFKIAMSIWSNADEFWCTNNLHLRRYNAMVKERLMECQALELKAFWENTLLSLICFSIAVKLLLIIDQKETHSSVTSTFQQKRWQLQDEKNIGCWRFQVVWNNISYHLNHRNLYSSRGTFPRTARVFSLRPNIALILKKVLLMI